MLRTHVSRLLVPEHTHGSLLCPATCMHPGSCSFRCSGFIPPFGKGGQVRATLSGHTKFEHCIALCATSRLAPASARGVECRTRVTRLCDSLCEGGGDGNSPDQERSHCHGCGRLSGRPAHRGWPDSHHWPGAYRRRE